MISKKVFNYKTFASYLFNGWRSVPWNRLYKRDFLRENKLFFSEIDNSEDVFFTNAALVDAERIFYLEKSCYYTYRDNNSGQLSRNLSGDIYCVAKELEKLKRKLTEEGIFESLKSSFWNYSVCAINPSLLNLNEEQQRELAGYYKEVWIPKTDMPVTNAEMFGYVEQYLTIKNICLREYTGYNCFLETYKMNLHSEDILRRIAVFFDKIQGRRSAIWGAGGRSREISVFLRDNDYEVECFLDNDEKKHGQFLEGRRIEAPSKLLEDLEWIIVLNKTFLYDVCRQIFTAGYKHIKVFDMETYVYPRYTIEECTITEGMLSIL